MRPAGTTPASVLPTSDGRGGSREARGHSAASARPSGLFKSRLKYLCSCCSRHRFLIKSPYSLLCAGELRRAVIVRTQ